MQLAAYKHNAMANPMNGDSMLIGVTAGVRTVASNRQALTCVVALSSLNMAS